MAPCRLVTPGFTGGCGSISNVTYSYVSCTPTYPAPNGTFVPEPNASMSCWFLLGKLYAQDAKNYDSRVYQIVISVSGVNAYGNSVSQTVTGITITVPSSSTAAATFPNGCSTGGM
jgi:hypothetical protein